MSLLLVTSVALAQKEETKEASGEVKSVAAKTMTIAHEGKEWTFVIDNETTVVAKGASHKMRAAEEAGKSTVITDFVMAKQSVEVKYAEKDGKLYAKEIRVR
jgi:hypothetical protein